jgi:hypothetical protein
VDFAHAKVTSNGGRRTRLGLLGRKTTVALLGDGELDALVRGQRDERVVALADDEHVVETENAVISRRLEELGTFCGSRRGFPSVHARAVRGHATGRTCPKPTRSMDLRYPLRDHTCMNRLDHPD